MSEDKQKLVNLGKEIEKIQQTFPEIIRDSSEKWKLYMDNLAEMLENWYQQKSVWATALRFITLKYGSEFEIELPEGHKNIPFLVKVDTYPKEGSDNIWTVKIDVIESETKDE